MMTLVAFGCQDQLELQPQQSLSTEESLKDLDGMTTALFGAYDGLQSLDYYGREYLVMPEVEANLVYLAINNSNRFVANYLYQWTSTSGDITAFWNVAYTAILRVNNIINNIDALEGDQARKDQLKGEALAIRALAHFDLVRVFAKQYTQSSPTSDLGVPVILESIIDEPARNTIEQVYGQVIADLNAAAGLVEDQGIYRIGPDAVNAMLARVYLYKGDNGNAVNAAASVINPGNYTLASDFQAMYNAPGSSEEIFTLQFVGAENRGSNNLGSIYNPDSYGDIRVTTDLVNLYEDGDVRADLIYEAEKGGVMGLFQSKYTSQDNFLGLHSPKLFRLGELHLIRAEANFKLGNTDDALDEINALRGARNASALTEITMMDIIEERQRELAFEGHTKFDLLRNGMDITRNQCNTGLELSAPCGLTNGDNLNVYPIPQREIDVNQNMVQNPGYN